MFYSDEILDSNSPRFLCPFSTTYDSDEDCLFLSIYLPKNEFTKAVVYFVTDDQIDDEEEIKATVKNANTGVFIVNLRNGIFGYLHEGNRLVSLKNVT
jgi:hypothetical protein